MELVEREQASKWIYDLIDKHSILAASLESSGLKASSHSHIQQCLTQDLAETMDQ